MLAGVAWPLAWVRAALVLVPRLPGWHHRAVGLAGVLVSVADGVAAPRGLLAVSVLASVLWAIPWASGARPAGRVAWATAWLLQIAVVSRVGIAPWAPFAGVAWATLPWALTDTPHLGRVWGVRTLVVQLLLGAGIAAAIALVVPRRVPDAAIGAAVGAWRQGVSLGGVSIHDPARRVLARVSDPRVARMRAVAYDRWDGTRWHLAEGAPDETELAGEPVSGWQLAMGGVLLTPGIVEAWTVSPRDATEVASGWTTAAASAFPWAAVPGRARRGASGPSRQALEAWRTAVVTGRRYDPSARGVSLEAFEQGLVGGDCTHFATLGVLRARREGWTSRLVVGFAGGEGTDAGRVFRAEDAHAWVEVVVDGVWEPQEVTPGAAVGAPVADAATPAESEAVSQDVGAGVAGAATAASPGTSPGWLGRSRSPASAVLAVAVALLTIAAWIGVSIRRRGSVGWPEITALLRARAPTLVRDTPRATAAALREAWGDDAAPVEAYVDAYYAARYGASPVAGLGRLASAAARAVRRSPR
jgi:hypothetical protein